MLLEVKRAENPAIYVDSAHITLITPADTCSRFHGIKSHITLSSGRILPTAEEAEDLFKRIHLATEAV